MKVKVKTFFKIRIRPLYLVRNKSLAKINFESCISIVYDFEHNPAEKCVVLMRNIFLWKRVMRRRLTLI